TQIDSMTAVLDQKIINQLENLEIEKDNSTNKELYDASIEYLKYIRDLEADLKPFLESIKDTIIENEEELSIPVREKALRMRIESNKWNKAAQKFYDKYNIKQPLVDSL